MHSHPYHLVLVFLHTSQTYRPLEPSARRADCVTQVTTYCCPSRRHASRGLETPRTRSNSKGGFHREKNQKREVLRFFPSRKGTSRPHEFLARTRRDTRVSSGREKVQINRRPRLNVRNLSSSASSFAFI